MAAPTTDVLVQASRIFLSLAYPGGVAGAPEARRACLALPLGLALTDPASLQTMPAGQLEIQRQPDGSLKGCALRLGSVEFPHLKLRLQRRVSAGREHWLFGVDTHDAFSRDQRTPPLDHPDAPNWAALQKANADLKVKIERAWEAAGLETFNTYLSGGLSNPPGDVVG